MLLVVLVGLVLVPLTGGSLDRLGQIGIVHSWAIFVGLGLQLGVTTIFPDLPVGPSKAVHVASYLFILWFLVSNRRIRGVNVIGLGTVLNFAAIVANGGTMPMRPAALRRAGIHLAHAFENSAPVRHPRLWFLGDVFAIPKSVPLANVFSVGDVLIDVGALVLILVACRTSDLEPIDRVEAPAARSPRLVSCADGWFGQA